MKQLTGVGFTTQKIIFLISIVLSVIIFTSTHDHLQAAKPKDSWKQWLKEVEPIITRGEYLVARLLKTEEEQTRFQQAFWKARDTIPQTPENEFQLEYQQRIAYAKKYLDGIRSDQGKIYLILGKPTNQSHYDGHHALVDCELWNYENINRPGLLPFMNLLFFRPHNTGSFQLYHPGIHGPRDLLSPQYANNIHDKFQAFKEIKMLSSELAQASLSIVPGEGDPYNTMSLSSSNYALNQVYSLPEREAAAGYIKNFKNPAGSVQVSHSTSEIPGYGHIMITRNRGISFLHYAIMPQTLTLKPISSNQYSADIHLLLSIDQINGTPIYQDRRTVQLKTNLKEKQNIETQKIVFRDFVPLIHGQFDVSITFINSNTQEFFTFKEQVTVGENYPTLLVGYQVKTVDQRLFMPFSYGQDLILTDPRSTFSQKEALEGIVTSTQPPEIFLENNQSPAIPIQANHVTDDLYRFHHPLSAVKDGKYRLVIRSPRKNQDEPPLTLERMIHILPYYIQVTRPYAMEKPGPASAIDDYRFILGQQSLNAQNDQQALAYFQQIPVSSWKPGFRPFIANAFYRNHQYQEVLQLLDHDEVKKTYPVLQMLANSAIELKRYPQALDFLERIRAYGDSREILNLIASTHLCMGNQQKARVYYEKARKLKNNNYSNKIEDTHE